VGSPDLVGQRLVALVSFDGGRTIDAAALLQRQHRAVTRKWVVRVSRFVWFESLAVAELKKELPSGVQDYFGGRLQPPATGIRALEALGQLRPTVWEDLVALSRLTEPRPVVRRAGSAIVAMEKDAVGLALDIAGLERAPIGDWTDPGDSAAVRPFLAGLARAQLREEQIVNWDVKVFGDWEVVRENAIGSVEFERDGQTLTVVNVNRLAPERSMGVDLIYFHERYGAFVMVQYKRMLRETGSNGEEMLIYRPDSSHAEEVARMDRIGSSGQPAGPNDYRLHDGVCYLKLCNPETLDPYATKLLPGFYLPLDYFKLLANSEVTRGPKGGRIFGYDNIEGGRRLTNSLFVDLVQDAWVGSHGDLTAKLRPIVEFMVESGRSVFLAVESQANEPEQGETEEP
jgi:hypothetical protein